MLRIQAKWDFSNSALSTLIKCWLTPVTKTPRVFDVEFPIEQCIERLTDILKIKCASIIACELSVLII